MLAVLSDACHRIPWLGVCTQCDALVLPLVLQGLLDPKHLEDLTGLTELHRSCEATLEAWASEDEGEEGGAEDGGGGGKPAAPAGEEDWEEL
jgi:hypothetical protein